MKKILVVDDESDLANVLEEIFHTFGYPFLALDNFRCFLRQSHLKEQS
jgi:CheY-like chemotaxis protein